MISALRKAGLLAAVAAAVMVGTPAAVSAGAGNPTDNSAKPLSLAVIGDVPYGAAQEAAWTGLIDAINADPKVRLALHVGDIKSGSTHCSDERFAAVKASFDAFRDPVVYTPGDNEWTDCHRANNGTYNPHERLEALRGTFFAEPGSVLGRRPMRVDYQAGMVENVRWVESRVAFATLHVLGSNNGLGAWTGLGFSATTPAQAAEVQARIDAAIAWIDETFDLAESRRLAGVVLAMQADTWDPMPESAQQEVVARIAERTAAFPGEVLLLQGDSHEYVADDPLGLDNFTRIVVHGETLPFEYLRLTINPVRGDLFQWERVQVS